MFTYDPPLKGKEKKKENSTKSHMGSREPYFPIRRLFYI